MNNDCMVGKRFDKISKIESSFTVECPLFALKCGIRIYRKYTKNHGKLSPRFHVGNFDLCQNHCFRSKMDDFELE